MIGRIIDSSDGILHHNDTGGNIATSITRRVKQCWKKRADVKAGLQHDLLHWSFSDDLGYEWTAQRPLDKTGDAIEAEAKRGLTILLRAKQVTDSRRLAAFYRREQQSLLSIQLLQDGRDLQVGIDWLQIGQHTIALSQTPKRRAEARIQNLRHTVLFSQLQLSSQNQLGKSQS